MLYTVNKRLVTSELIVFKTRIKAEAYRIAEGLSSKSGEIYIIREVSQ